MFNIDIGVIALPDYKKMYTTLFNAMTDAIEILQRAQQQAEEQYMQSGQPAIRILLPDEVLPPDDADSPALPDEDG